ncbi:MAG: lytic transglycosylase domain-containing protein [Armatimonadota bacterium]
MENESINIQKSRQAGGRIILPDRMRVMLQNLKPLRFETGEKSETITALKILMNKWLPPGSKLTANQNFDADASAALKAFSIIYNIKQFAMDEITQEHIQALKDLQDLSFFRKKKYKNKKTDGKKLYQLICKHGLHKGLKAFEKTNKNHIFVSIKAPKILMEQGIKTVDMGLTGYLETLDIPRKYRQGDKYDEIPAIKTILNIWLPDKAQIKVNDIFDSDMLMALKAFSKLMKIRTSDNHTITKAHINAFVKSWKDLSYEKSRLYRMLEKHGLHKGMLIFTGKKKATKQKLQLKTKKFFTLADMFSRLKPFKEQILKAAGENGFNTDEFFMAVLKASTLYSLPPGLIIAVISVESSFGHKEVSGQDACGFMQVTKIAAEDIGYLEEYESGEIFDIETNIMCGSKYLRKMLDRFNGNLKLAIAAYNRGPTEVEQEFKKHKKYDKMELPLETKYYVANVLKAYNDFM